MKMWTSTCVFCLWSLANSTSTAQDTRIQIVAQFAGPITSLFFVDESKQPLIVYQNRLAELELSTGKTIREIELPIAQALDVEFSARRKQLFIAGGDPGQIGTVLNLDWPTGELNKRLNLHSDVITDIALSPDETEIAMSSIDYGLTVYNLETGVSQRFEGHSKPVTGILWLDPTTIVSGGEDTSLRVWNTKASTPVRTLNQHLDSMTGLVALTGTSNTEAMIASFGRDRTVRLWQPGIGRMIRFTRFDSQPRRLLWIATTQNLIVGDAAGHLHWVDWKTSKILETKAVTDGWIESLTITPDGKSILVGDDTGRLIKVGADIVR